MADPGGASSPIPTCAPWHSTDATLRFSRRAVRDLDRLATEEFGIPSIVLMENAGLRTAEFAAGALPALPGRGVLVVAGPGNNGGDGLVAARHLANAGLPAGIVLAGPAAESKEDARTNLLMARALNLPIFEVPPGDPAPTVEAAMALLGPGGPALVIDALLGTGLERAPREPVRTLIRLVNALGRAGRPVLSVDIPSGLDADTGLAAGGKDGLVVAARWTVTLVGPKQGFAEPRAAPFLGEVRVADIGAPRALMARLGIPAAASR